MSHLIFVYGTLKSGNCREGVLKDQRYIGVAKTSENYALFDLGSFPGMIHARPNLAAARKIYGEIYEIDSECLKVLDRIEGIDHGFYSREFITLDEINIANLPLNNNTFQNLHKKTAEAYIYLGDISYCKECGSFWSPR